MTAAPAPVAAVVAALRLALGAALAWCVASSATAPELPPLCAAAVVGVVAATALQARWGLMLATALAPAGALFAAAPARAAELFAWALVAGWLLSIWRPLSRPPWPRDAMLPLGLYAGVLIASWLALTVGGAAGVPPPMLAEFIAQSIPRDHLILSSPEPETWTLLQSLAGVAVFIVAAAAARSDSRTVRSLAVAIVASLVILAAATFVDVARQWADVGYEEAFLMRYLRGERFSLIADVNAAGSLYAVAAVVAIGHAWLRPAHRAIWLSVLAVLGAGIWLSGSRSAYLAVLAGVAIVAGMRQRWQATGRHVMAVAAVFVAAMIAAAIIVAPQSDIPGSASQSANLRSQFLLTSARMFASAPIFGVGIGRYFGRSPEFMTPELRDLYGNENAHNYVAQQFAELGVVGGVLFIWLVVATLWRGWRTALRAPDEVGLQTLFAGTAAYVVTCATGHPLLVPEASLPFWAAFGAVAGRTSDGAVLSMPRKALGIAAAVVMAAGIGRAALVYSRAVDIPPEQGFHQFETTRDGVQFRWMTRHAVTYIPEQAGFLRLRLRAPAWPAPRPVVLETSIAGRVVDRHEIPPDDSTILELPAPDAIGSGFRRVDFWINQEWFEEVPLGQRRARRPISLMVEDMEWMPLR